MTIDSFIKACSRAVHDPTLNVITAMDWLDILNFQSGELYPEIGYRGQVEFNAPTSAAEYQIDLSSFSNLEAVKEVYVKDTEGKEFLYDNWIFDKELKLLDLKPHASKLQTIDPAEYEKVIVIWFGYFPIATTLTAKIDLTPPKIILLEKVCIREALRRILFDHAKLDRYRILVGRMNEYALMAMIRDYTTEIELTKRRLVDTHSVKSF